MRESAVKVSNFVAEYTKRLADGIPEDQMVNQPAPGLNPPAWILAHVAIAYDYGLLFLGKKATTPDGWLKTYGPGSSPIPPEPRPTKAELLAANEKARQALCAAYLAATAEELAAPHEFGPMKEVTPSKGDILLHLLTTHAVSHLGQLSAWRRIKGLPAVLGF